MSNKLIPVLFLLGLAVWVAPLAAEDRPVAPDPVVVPSAEAPKVAATVDGEEIPREKFVEDLIRLYGKRHLERMIGEKIAIQALTRHKIGASAAEQEAWIERELKRLLMEKEWISQQQTGKSFAKMLLKQGSTVDEYKRNRRREMVKDPAVIKRFVQMEKLIVYFLLGRERVTVTEILVPTRAEAEKLLHQINDPDSGETFESIATRMKKQSQSLYGGTLHPFAKNDFRMKAIRYPLSLREQVFSQTAFSLAEGDCSEVFETRVGFHIIQLDKRYPAERGSFNELKAKVGAIIREGKNRPAPVDHRLWEHEERARRPVVIAPDLIKLFGSTDPADSSATPTESEAPPTK